MTAIKLLSDLKRSGIHLWVNKGELHYKAPKGVLTPTFRKQLQERKVELLNLLTHAKVSTEFPLIVPVDRTGPLSLSFAQQRLWFLHQLESKSSAYNSPLAMRLQGLLDVAALKQSLQTLVDRHETLRTCFPAVDGQPSQVIADSVVLPWEQQDLREVPEAERQAAAQERIQSLVQQPFDLDTGPLIRTHLLQLADEEFVLLLNLHHIVSDGWSLGVASRELAALYGAFVHDQPLPLRPLRIQYADFAHWQRQWLTGEVLDQQLTYWREQLAALPVLELPTDRPRPAMQTYDSAIHSVPVDQPLMENLNALSRQAGVSLAITLLAAFQVLLARYTGQTDIVVGSPIANRNRQDIEGLIGFFVNSLVMRTDLSGDPSFREAIARVQEVSLGAYDHQDLPFEQLVEELQPQRDSSRNPLFQVMFAVQNAPFEGFTFSNVTVKPFSTGRATTRFDLECHVWEGPESLHLRFCYNTQLFDPATIERLGSHFHKVLAEVGRDPAQTLSQISLLEEAEHHRMVVAWNATHMAYPREATIAGRFDAQVEVTPDAVAVVFEDQSLTYADLNTRATQLAHYLRQQGVGPEVCVGLCVERSLEMVVGILGILKAGGAYVPLDPQLPPGRLAFMLQDADIAMVLTQGAVKEHLPREWVGQVVALDREWAAIAQMPDTNVASGVIAENLAYIMYTSGSTGLPKGTSISHRNVVRLVTKTNYLNFGPKETFLQFAPLAFDASTLELWGSLLHGAKLVIFPPHTPSLKELGHCLQDQGISTLWLTAALFHQMVDSQLEALRGVRHLLAGGDVLSVPHVQRVVANLSENGRLINGYGPTENTTFTCSHVMEPGSEVEAPVPIGTPIANTQTYVLDRTMQPVPVGVYGELYIGGDGLARNYLKQPGLTAERFVPHPFSAEPGARLYKTGDVVRYRAEGAMEFKGRMDHQVKVRGYRIELGEVDTVLSQHPAVQEAVVVQREDTPGEKRLVAYIVTDDDTASAIEELRHFVKARLPEYMVPAFFVRLDALPLTPNGKVDRRALPEPEGSLTSLVKYFVPPRSPVEEFLAEIWRDILRVRQVGVHDNFFELGGHSLLATQVVSRVYQAFGVELPLKAFFEQPTVAGITDFLTSTPQAGEEMARPPLAPVSRENQLPLSFAQERLWLLEQFDPGNAAYSMPAALRLSGGLNLSALEQSLSHTFQRHEVLRTSYVVVNEKPVQVIAPAENFSLPVIDLEAFSPDVQQQMVQQQLEELNRPFNLAQGPLIRVSLLRLGPEEHVLLLVLHHSIADGLSLNILYRELATGYEAACQGEVVTQPPLPIQYADYAVWQRQWLQGGALEGLVRYWTHQLSGAPARLALPTDYPRPAVQTHRGAHHTIHLPGSVVSSLKALSQSEGVTMFMTLLAAFGLLLSRHAGQEDIVVGTPVANRSRSELEGMIGLFLNTLVLRMNLVGDPTFRELLQRVKEVCLDAYAHQELPFEKLVEELQPERDLSRTPLFQVFFNLVDVSETRLTLPGLTVSPLRGAPETTKFDLTLYVFLAGQEARLTWSYNRDLFDHRTIAWMAEQLQTVLTHLPQTPDHLISTVSLLPEEDRTRLRTPAVPVRPTQSFVEVPEADVARSIPARFEAQVCQRPDNVAVQTSQYQWTYEEVNRRANQIAHTLLSQQFPAESRIALLCAHDAPMIATILGVLKAGYTYVPLDPDFPQARLEAIAADAQVAAILAESTYLPLAHTLEGAAGRVLDLDQAFTQTNTRNPQHIVSPDTLAYLLYTSGTTGVPKGVMQCHRHVLHHNRVYTNNLSISAKDRLTLLAGYGFDAAVMDLFGALLNGATLYPLNLKETDPASLSTWVWEKAITIYHSTPTVYRYWTSTLEERMAFPGLRLIVLGGEEATRADFEVYQQRFGPDCLFVNGLGPTESTVSLQFMANPQTTIIGQTVPVGYPVEHTEITLLDQAGQETEVYGEIAIRSPYVAVGYWQQPTLTHNVFGSAPDQRGRRLYRTGDLGRRRFDGSLEFMGRKDAQVKIRGHRIELGEIETVLRQHPAVQETVVVAREDDPGERRVGAYVVPVPEADVTVAQLRTYLGKHLPEYMAPGSWVFLEALPLTPNGKVDRRALPTPQGPRASLEISFVAPRTTTEEVLAGIWAEVLKLDQVGIHDNFFDLGGHSLLGTQVMARIRHNLNVEVLLRGLFETPTIAGLAEVIDRVRPSVPESSTTASSNGENRVEIEL